MFDLSKLQGGEDGWKQKRHLFQDLLYADAAAQRLRRNTECEQNLFSMPLSYSTFALVERPVGGEMKVVVTHLRISSIRMTGNEMRTTAFHSCQFSGTIWNRVEKKGT